MSQLTTRNPDYIPPAARRSAATSSDLATAGAVSPLFVFALKGSTDERCIAVVAPRIHVRASGD